MKRHCFLLMLAGIALIITGGPTKAQAQSAPSFVAHMEVTDEVVTFQPRKGAYVDFMMTVAGPDDFWLEQHFASDETPSLRIKTPKGLILPDGSYTIELRARPMISDKQREALTKARNKGDRYEMRMLMKEMGFNPAAMVYSTYLGVAERAFLDPENKEELPRNNLGALENTLEIQSVQLTGRRWDAAYLPNQPNGYVAADATNAAVHRSALVSANSAPPFTQAASPQTASWYEATFQNTSDDGTLLSYQGYLRPVALDGQAKLFHAYFHEVDGAVPGPWQEGYFRAEEGSYRFLNHAEVTQSAKPAPLFDYVAQKNTPPDALDATLPDFVINDDLIVDGSACIGFDCVNGEVFGFDTIRLKENNLRIGADDTSTAASFPKNDWQLTFNDSANGGASKFSVDDITGGRTPFTVEANARSHSLYVDDGGRIGSRTSTPSVEIHTIDGDTPTLRLQQDGSSGFAPQTWDVAGNETNFFVRDVTNGSQLPFRIRPDAPTSSLFIDTDGDIGLGTSSPDAVLHIQKAGSGAQPDLLISNDDGGAIGTGVELRIEDVNPQMQLFETDASQTFSFLSNGGNMQFREGSNTLLTLFSSTGLVSVTNELTAGTKTFKIDHPLDPENKFLNHVSIESPDMMNVYNGNAVFDANGEAVVELPDYFEALNQDYRYQLTCIGGFAPVYIAEKIVGNRFKIAGGQAGMEVSWQVTGIRHDPFAVQRRVQVEVDKPAALRGRYLHPTEYNQPMERSIYYDPLEVKEVNQGGGQ